MNQIDPDTGLNRALRFRLAGVAGALALRALGITWRVQWDLPEPVRELERDGFPLLYAFWHEHLLPLAWTHRGRDAAVLISESEDGEYISQVIHHLGYTTVRGSSSRSGVKALMRMARIARSGDRPLGMTPDGPRGPRRRLQPGLILVAHRSGIPVVPTTVGVRGGHRLESWDRFQIPLPFSRLKVISAPPISIPEEIPADDAHRRWTPIMESAFAEIEARAAVWSGQDPESEPGPLPDSPANARPGPGILASADSRIDASPDSPAQSPPTGNP